MVVAADIFRLPSPRYICKVKWQKSGTQKGKQAVSIEE